MERRRPTFAEINLSHLTHNALALRQLMPASSFFCPMVKADAYGHGSWSCAQALENVGISDFGVAMLEEAIFLRQKGLRGNILSFGHFEEKDVQWIHEAQITPVISQMSQIQSLKKFGKPISVHIKIDTGMHRMGFWHQDLSGLKEELEKQAAWLKILGVGTHLYQGEDFQQGSSAHIQAQNLQAVEKYFPQVRHFHLWNSSGLLRASAMGFMDSAYQHFGSRPGLALYGASVVQSQSFQLLPVMSFQTQVVKINRVPAGDIVSYNGTWKAPRESWIAVLPVGYADGHLRSLSNQGYVYLGDQKAARVGTICMDYSMVDVTEIVQKYGTGYVEKNSVLIFGRKGNVHLPVEQVATWAGTIPWEVLTSVSARVPRVEHKNPVE